MLNNKNLPQGWAFDPEAEASEIHDTCAFCGAAIDDDTEIYLDHENGLTVVGCEHCIDSYSARELNDKGVTDFIELKYDPFMHEMRRVNRDDN